MKKLIKQFGNSLIITFDKEDKKIYNLEVEDIIEIEIKENYGHERN